MQLKGSKTHGNLKAAFAGESQANRRYLYFAAKADVEGQNDVAAVFRSTAEGETGHAHGHLEYLAQCRDPATRHPVAWRAPEFFEEAKLLGEMERVFSICHGCRRCVNLCTAFPTLFDLVDASATLEVDGVEKSQFWKVVDQCYLCDMCYMTKCPYVPPHPWNVDFPHLMLRAKAVKFGKGEVKLRDRLLSSTDVIGKLAAIPVVAQVVNAVNGNSAAPSLTGKVIGVHPERKLPPYSPGTFRGQAPASRSPETPNGGRPPGKSAGFFAL